MPAPITIRPIYLQG